MADSPTPVLPTCPDCGGILHPTRVERLTSLEVASADTDDDAVLVAPALLAPEPAVTVLVCEIDQAV